MNEKQPRRTTSRNAIPGGPMRAMHMEKPKNFQETIKRLIQYLQPYRLSIIIVAVFAAGSSVFAIIGPKLLGKATTRIFEGLINKVSGVSGAGIDFVYVGNIIWLLLGLYLLSSLFLFVQSYIISGVAQKISYQLRQDISLKIERLPLKYFDTKTHGEILSRITNDVDTISQTLNQSMSQIITSIVTLIGVLIMMFSISWLMTLAALLIMPLAMIFISLVIGKSQRYFKQQQEYLGHVNGHVEEIYSGHIIVKAFNGEKKAVEEFDELNASLYDSAWKSQFLSGMMMPIMSFIGNIGYVLVSVLGGWLAVKRTIEVGDILAFIQYVRQFNQPITQVAQVSNLIQSTAAAAERVFEFLDEEQEINDTGLLSISNEKVHGEVAFENVSFGYSPTQPIIKNFNVKILPGQKVAIVGPTGAGKTTIVKLLMRFYDVDQGTITVDGKDIRAIKRSDLRNMMGMVLQDTWLFNGTIKENIRYGRLEADDTEVIRAAQAAYAHSFIKALPDGYDMILNEEASNVSQGQKQLLTIARAILSDPKILILDEATSSVDTRTEVLIQKAMENLLRGRTSFIIAHRLSTIRNADLILVMRDGDIVEQGDHQSLLAANGFYASLYYSQFEMGDAV